MAHVRVPVLVYGLVAMASLSAGCGGDPHAGADDASPDGVGAAAVEAGITVVLGGDYDCPGISSFNIDNAQLGAGQEAHLGIVTVGPTPSFIQWTATPSSGGHFSSADAAGVTFECTGTGTVTVAVSVGILVDGRGNVCEGVPFTSYSASIRCE